MHNNKYSNICNDIFHNTYNNIYIYNIIYKYITIIDICTIVHITHIYTYIYHNIYI